jgi:hypothetical protein
LCAAGLATGLASARLLLHQARQTCSNAQQARSTMTSDY